MRALRAATVTINGRVLGNGPLPIIGARELTFDVTRLLVPGENQILATVSNVNGPPALWLRLEGIATPVHTDESWEASWAGASWQLARRAADTNRLFIDQGFGLSLRPAAAIRELWSELLGYVLSAAALMGVAALWLRWHSRHVGEAERAWKRLMIAVLAAVSVAWTAMFWRNTEWLHWTVGYDADGHLEYIDYILTNGALPLANEGWMMHHPPLYYLIMALALKTAPLITQRAAGITVIRMGNLLLGLANVVLVYGSLRLLFPFHPRRWFAGTLIAAFLPVVLHLYQTPSNETLAAALGSASLYASLRLICKDKPGALDYGLIGAALGAFMLTKFSALVVIAAVLSVLIWRTCRAWRIEGLGGNLTGLGILLFVCLTICGWHYGRVWMEFGRPLVAAWQPESGHVWWQDPGYRTVRDYTRFGDSLRAPIFNLPQGVWDALYSTLWGDALCSGTGSVQFRPPWSYQRMAAGYVLAIIPTLAIAAGLIGMVMQFVRYRQMSAALILAVWFGTCLAVVSMTITVPYYCNVKASYGLAALVPLCALAALGVDVLSFRHRWPWAVIVTGLVVWSANSYATFWIDSNHAATPALLALRMIPTGESQSAAAALQTALQLDPNDMDTWHGLAVLAIQENRTDQAHEWLELPPDAQDTAWKHDLLAVVSSRAGQAGIALRELDRAIAIEPNDPQLYIRRAQLLHSLSDTAGAIQAYLQVLRIDPFILEAHSQLSRLYLQVGDMGSAAEHERYASKLAKP